MLPDFLPWILFATCLALSVVLTLTLKRRKEQAHRILSQQAAKSDRQLQFLATEQSQELARLQQNHTTDRNRLVAQNKEVLGTLKYACGQLATGIKWERLSRNAIVDVCDDLGINGVLATNVIFIPPEATKDNQFVAQIDHVLVTDSVVIIIENKRWKGVIFDGGLPSSLHPAFGLLIDESKLDKHFAIQIVPDSDSALTIRSRGQTPGTQARQQARRLSHFVEVELNSKPWIKTCVFYSHPKALVHGPRRNVSEGGTVTEIAAGNQELRAVIKKLSQTSAARKNPSHARELGALLSALGADVVGLGTQKENWSESLISTRSSPATTQ